MNNVKEKVKHYFGDIVSEDAINRKPVSEGQEALDSLINEILEGYERTGDNE